MNLTASGMAAMLSCLLLFSCNDEDFLADNGNITGNACDNICFGISPDRNIQTRGNAASGEDGYTSGQFVLRSRDSADTLCVRATVSDGIHSPVLEIGKSQHGAYLSRKIIFIIHSTCWLIGKEWNSSQGAVLYGR